MSRIYDALQRADLERKAAQGTDTPRTAETPTFSGAEALPSIKADVIIENIPQYSWKPSKDFLPTLGDRGENIEQFRGLRSQLYQYRDEIKLKTILISSGMPAEGKTFVAANLAISLARNKNNKVLLIDGDLRSPSLHVILGAPDIPGLTEYLAGASEPNDIMQQYQSTENFEEGLTRGIPNLTFIPAGAGGDNSSELVANHRIEELIAILAPHFDWILIDSPPVLAVADSIDLARAADAVLLVARGASTPFDVAQRAQAAFSNTRILGFVLNAVKDAPRNAAYSYYYGYHESAGRTNKRKDKRPQG
ncbi:MAG: CpsD/CapB family tyrosine-protein kinase [Terracidiphilus sp.]|jgi:capsular exopolysaccharide synthesis family protein